MAKQRSALINILLALVPYTNQNLALAFKPRQFFNEIERGSNHSHQAVRVAYKRAIDKGYIQTSGTDIWLTPTGREAIKPYIANKLVGNVSLMVIFDIPEKLAHKRQRFRNVLKKLDFEQVQKSVWKTEMDYRLVLKETVEELNLRPYVALYECAKI